MKVGCWASLRTRLGNDLTNASLSRDASIFTAARDVERDGKDILQPQVDPRTECAFLFLLASGYNNM